MVSLGENDKTLLKEIHQSTRLKERQTMFMDGKNSIKIIMFSKLISVQCNSIQISFRVFLELQQANPMLHMEKQNHKNILDLF